MILQQSDINAEIFRSFTATLGDWPQTWGEWENMYETGYSYSKGEKIPSPGQPTDLVWLAEAKLHVMIYE